MEQEMPVEWAMVQGCLGNIYTDLPTGEKSANLQQAIACFEVALRVYTEQDYPYECAMTRSNLALARTEQGDVTGARQALLLAAQAYRRIGIEEGVREVEEELAGLPESG
jgi:hypothetical protein